MARPRVCFVVSAPETASAFLNPHIERLAIDYDIDVVANFSTATESRVTSKARHISVPIQRQIRPVADARSVGQLRSVLKRGDYDIVHSVTPKAGLIAMLAASSLGIRHRLHWFTGQVWATKAGNARRLLKAADRLTARLAIRAFVDSPSQLDFLVREGVVDRKKATVLGSGSICGVDTNRFRPNPSVRRKVRGELGIDDGTAVVLYVGRINRDKGIPELIDAMGNLQTDARVCLLLAGEDEQGLMPEARRTLAGTGVEFIYVGPTDSPENLMAAADIFCMPSHREGFGLSVIEAASCELPCVASSIYGLTDAVVDGVTGLLFPAGDAAVMANCLKRLLGSSALRSRLGSSGRMRVVQEFGRDRLTQALQSEYQTLLSATRRQGPHHG